MPHTCTLGTHRPGLLLAAGIAVVGRQAAGAALQPLALLAALSAHPPPPLRRPLLLRRPRALTTPGGLHAAACRAALSCAPAAASTFGGCCGVKEVLDHHAHVARLPAGGCDHGVGEEHRSEHSAPQPCSLSDPTHMGLQEADRGSRMRISGGRAHAVAPSWTLQRVLLHPQAAPLPTQQGRKGQDGHPHPGSDQFLNTSFSAATNCGLRLRPCRTSTSTQAVKDACGLCGRSCEQRMHLGPPAGGEHALASCRTCRPGPSQPGAASARRCCLCGLHAAARTPPHCACLGAAAHPTPFMQARHDVSSRCPRR